MNKKETSVVIDPYLKEQAIKKAKSEGLEIDFKALLRLLMFRVNEEKMKLIIDVPKRSIETTLIPINYYPEHMKRVRSILSNQDIKPTTTYVIQLLLESYINQ